MQDLIRKHIRYRLRCSSRVRKVMRLGSGSERRRCIMQFSLAAGSDSAVSDTRNMFIVFTLSPHLADVELLKQ